MIIREFDLFQGFENDVVEEIMTAASTVTLKKGEAMFNHDDPADGFYVLNSGAVELVVPDTRYAPYVARSIGEIVGWSSMAGRETYSAGAVCLDDTRVIKFDKQKLDTVLRRHPAVGLLFYKRLCRAVGERLIECHHTMVKMHSTG